MYNALMLVSKFDDLCRRKAYLEKRKLPLKVISDESKIAVSTLQKVKRSDQIQHVSVQTLIALCSYFKVKSLSDLLDWQPDPDKPE